MASGLEALGAASAVLQVISFSLAMAKQCIAFYNGTATAHDELGEYSKQLEGAADRAESSCKPLALATSSTDAKVLSIARKCQDAAQKLQMEVKDITVKQQKGKFLHAIRAGIRSQLRQSKLQSLEKDLEMQKKAMETHILAYICSQNQALDLQQKDISQTLSRDVQGLVQQIADGKTRLEAIVVAAHDETREQISKQIKSTEAQMSSHVTSEMEKLNIAAITAAQRTRLLESLRTHDMNQRYNDIMHPDEATFERVFTAYDRLTRNDLDYETDTSTDGTESITSSVESTKKPTPFDESVDREWASFVSWLQEEDPIFWIRGKPGAGKSTLMKFVLANERTEALLSRWRPNPVILCHYFWKIGSKPQNSIKGLICSLIYQILEPEDVLVNHVLGSAKVASQKSSYHDWSQQEVSKLLFGLLNHTERYFCIFIDGLDEVCDKDGPHSIMNMVTKLSQHQKLKICVTSRPETHLVHGLEKLGARGIRLERLTASDMHEYVRGKFEPMVKDGTISDTVLSKLVGELSAKADGVFLWLQLATRSLIDGALQGDSQAELLARLKELPTELEDLYTDMWRRLNHNKSIYQKTAAELLQMALHSDVAFTFVFPSPDTDNLHFHGPELCLFQMACARSSSLADTVLQDGSSFSSSRTREIYNELEKDVHMRCAGLLEVRSALDDFRSTNFFQRPDWAEYLTRRVCFIHRTAHNYLKSTEAGQEILKHSSLDPELVPSALFRGGLRLAYLLQKKAEICLWVVHALLLFEEILGRHATNHADYYDLLIEFKEAYDSGAIRDLSPLWYPKVHFVNMSTGYPDLVDHMLPYLSDFVSTTDAEHVLRNIWFRRHGIFGSPGKPFPSIKLIKKLMAMTARWHSCGTLVKDRTFGILIPTGTCLTLMLQRSCEWLRSSDIRRRLDAKDRLGLLQIALELASTCPNLGGSIIVWDTISRVFDDGRTIKGIYLFHRIEMRTLLYELVLELTQVAELDEMPVALKHQVDGILSEPQSPSFEPRFILDHDNSVYQVTAPAVFAHLGTAVFKPWLERSDWIESEEDELLNQLLSLAHNPNAAVKVSAESAAATLAEEEFGFITAEQAGIVLPAYLETPELTTSLCD